MKIFVTGGGGFLGQAIVRQLLEAGHAVVSFSRGTYKALDELGVSHIQGNLSDYEALEKGMKGCEAIIHTASKVGMWGSYKAFYEANVKGTQNVLQACQNNGIPYLVFTSSPSVVYSGNVEGGNENLPYPDEYDAYYPETKAIAEKAVLAANSSQLCTCALRPHLIWGPGDHFVPRLFERQRKGQLRLVGEGEYLVDTIYVDNAASAHLLALKAMLNDPTSVGGKAYFLSQDKPITIREFMNRLLATGGFPPVAKTISPQLALAAGWILQTAHRLLKTESEPRITPFVAKQLSSAHWYDISAAKRDLDYEPVVSIEEGMEKLKVSLSQRKLKKN